MIKKENLILLVLSTVATLYLLEIGLFLAKVHPYSMYSPTREARMQAADQVGQSYDRRTRSEYFLDAQRQGRELAVSWLSPGQIGKGLQDDQGQIMPFTGVSNSPTLFCNESGEWLEFHSGPYGFRNPMATDRQRENADVVILGDSFAMGTCVPDDPGALLRRQGLTTANLGMSGFGPLTELATLREYGAPIKPKNVIWMYYEGNDLRNLDYEKHNPILMRYLQPGFSQNLMQQQPRIDALARREIAVRLERKLKQNNEPSWFGIAQLSGIHAILKRFYSQLVAPHLWKLGIGTADLELLQHVLGRAKMDAEAWGGEIYFVYLPHWKRFGIPQTPQHGAPYKDQVLEIVETLGFPIIDFTTDVEQSGDPLGYFPFRMEGHYVEHAFVELSEKIGERLAETNRPPKNGHQSTDSEN